jgi:hypothetical protein
MTKAGEILFWTPRLMCIVAIVVMSMLSFDAFKPEFSSWHQIRTFILHMVPSFTLILLLLLAWRKELTGGTIFIVVGMLLSVFLYRYNYQEYHSFIKSFVPVALVALPFCLTGILFVVDYFYKKRHRKLIH